MFTRAFNRKIYLAALTTAVVLAGQAGAAQTGDAVTVSLSGSTAMSNFTRSAYFSLLNPGGSITLNSGLSGAEVVYKATAGSTTAVQLATNNFLSGYSANPSTGVPAGILDPAVNSAQYRGLRVEWHEQGSVEGILELINDQIGTVTSVAASDRNPLSSNRVWVNTGSFSTAPGSFNGLSIATSTHANSSFNTSGLNVEGGQNRVQMAISDVNARQGFATSGTPAFTRAPGQSGYGLGNPALPLGATIQGLGSASTRKQMNEVSIANMPQDKVDPGTGANYGSGAWNSGGIDNLQNTTVAITATLAVANPGTGLHRLNRTDAQWLQTTGRLQNGADFNMVTRDAYSGTLNVFANNSGVDPTWVVGENDDGNGNLPTGGTTQVKIGPGIKFSGKTSGGSGLRPTVQNSRMAVGHLSISDSIGVTNDGAGRPLRALAYRDDADDLKNGSNALLQAGFDDATGGTFVQPSASSIVDGSYVFYQNQTYVTVKRPDSVEYTQDFIKGDNSGNDVRDVRNNIISSVNSFPPSSTGSPADGLVQNSFVLPQFMKVKKTADGLNQSVANLDYNAGQSGSFLASATLTSKFNPAVASAVTTGATSRYGDTTPTGGQGSIVISAQNYLFGNFKQNGVRDFAAVKAAQEAQAALAAGTLGVDMFAGAANSNNTGVTGLTGALATMNAGNLATKGDLIVMGDFDSNGIFNGKDLYLMARGAALADNTSTDQLTLASGADFGDQVRKGVLRKNAALDYMASVATDQQKIDASANTTNDASGANAFNKADVNRDGLVNRADAQIVDAAIGLDYRNINDQLGAVIATNGTLVDGKDISGNPVVETARSISLVDVELNDTGDITYGASGDWSIIRTAVGAGLTGGDANFDGKVDSRDFDTLVANYGSTGMKWSQGDFDGIDGKVNTMDFNVLAGNFGSVIPGAALGSVVPEPASLSLLVLGASALLRRRR